MTRFQTHQLLRTLLMFAIIMLAALLGNAQELLVGGELSGGMGEHALAPVVEARATVSDWRASGLWSLSRKTESDAGYRVALDVDRTLGPTILGAGVHYRNGGPWSKTGAWVMAGVGNRQTRVMLRHELPTSQDLNDVWALGAVGTLGRFEFRSEVLNYRQSGERRFGATQTVMVKVN